MKEDLRWMDQGACNGEDPNVMFPDTGGRPLEIAQEICKGCVVVDECLDYALKMPLQSGVWGGTSERERRRILKRLRDEAAPVAENPETEAGTAQE